MFNSCKRHIDYTERRETIKSGIVHAISKNRESACGRYFNAFGDSKSVINTTPITCKSCLKALSANDTDVTINMANLFAIRTEEGLFLDNKGSLTSNISNARLFKIKENAENAIKEDVYINRKDENDVISCFDFKKRLNAIRLGQYHLRQDLYNTYRTAKKIKKGFNIVSVALSFNENSSYNESCPRE